MQLRRKVGQLKALLPHTVTIRALKHPRYLISKHLIRASVWTPKYLKVLSVSCYNVRVNICWCRPHQDWFKLHVHVRLEFWVLNNVIDSFIPMPYHPRVGEKAWVWGYTKIACTTKMKPKGSWHHMKSLARKGLIMPALFPSSYF